MWSKSLAVYISLIITTWLTCINGNLGNWNKIGRTDACIDTSPQCAVTAFQCKHNYFVQTRCKKTCNLCPDPCNPNPCGANAKCNTNANGIASCTCPAGFVGNAYTNCRKVQPSVCQIGYIRGASGICIRDVPKNPCASNPCAGFANTECNSAGKGSCQCLSGYEGNPSKGCTRDPCRHNHCGFHAICETTTAGAASCTCPDGYEGNPLDKCLPIHACWPNPCGANAKCHARLDHAYCVCPRGQAGDPLVQCSPAQRRMPTRVRTPLFPWYPVLGSDEDFDDDSDERIIYLGEYDG